MAIITISGQFSGGGARSPWQQVWDRQEYFRVELSGRRRCAQYSERRAEVEVLAHGKDRARFTADGAGKLNIQDSTKHVRAIWGTPPHHPPAKLGCRYGCGNGMIRTHPVSIHRNVPVSKQELCPVCAKEPEKEIPRENSQSVSQAQTSQVAVKQAMHPDINLVVRAPSGHTAQTL